MHCPGKHGGPERALSSYEKHCRNLAHLAYIHAKKQSPMIRDKSGIFTEL